jgi:membrane protein YdbS with pleckstrin-like domain
MEDRLIRPSMKTVWAAYGVAIVVILAGIWAYFEYVPNWPPWSPAILLIMLVPAARMHLSRRMITLRFHDDHLTLETGFLSRTRRTVDMAKIQDVTVRQTLGQRLLGVGDLMLESAGEIADQILANSKRSPGKLL